MSLYARNVGLFVAIGAVILLPYSVIVVVLAAALVGSDQAIIDTLAQRLADMGRSPFDAVPLYYDLVAVALALAIIIFLLVMEPIAAAALTTAVARRYSDRPASVWLAYRGILPRVGPLVVTMLWAVLRLIPLIIACAILIGIPLVCYFLVAWFFAAPIIVLEDNAGSATKRSSYLVQLHRDEVRNLSRLGQ